MGYPKQERDMLKAKKIKTFLWLDGQAEEAGKFCTSVFRTERSAPSCRPGLAIFSAEEAAK
jgi:hypothetical protein